MYNISKRKPAGTDGKVVDLIFGRILSLLADDASSFISALRPDLFYTAQFLKEDQRQTLASIFESLLESGQLNAYFHFDELRTIRQEAFKGIEIAGLEAEIDKRLESEKYMMKNKVYEDIYLTSPL